MINEQLFKEIVDISKKGILIDKQMIRKLVREIVSNTDFMTRRRYKYTYFRHCDNFCGKTNINQGKICFSIKTCYEEVENFKKISILEKNLHIIAIILHEIEHLQEPRKTRKNKFDGKIIRISNKQKNYFNNGGDVNFDTYYLDPSEKIAFANSYKKLLEYLDNYPNFKEQYFEEYKNINNEYVERLFYGYEKKENGDYNIPLIDFIVAIKKISSLKELNFKLVKKEDAKNIKKINIEKRLMYGLPVSSEEVENFEKQKILTRKI